MKDYGENKVCLYEEPYVTINGEGHYIGMPAVFVRFMGCNVGCVWCDAFSTWPDPKSGTGMWYTNKQLTDFLDANCANTSRIWLTGGEPTEHSEEVWSFVKYYKKYGKYERIFHLITSGAIFNVKLLYELDFITIDIKPPSSKAKTPPEFIMWCMEDAQLREKVEFKMVVDKSIDDINFAMTTISNLQQFHRDITLQPMYWSEGRAKKEEKMGQAVKNLSLFIEEFAQPQNWEDYAEFAEHFMEILRYENVRILPQLHKVYWPGQFEHI